MADRFLLIANSSANQIQEIASGDNLDLSGNSIVNANDIAARNITGVAATFSSKISVAGITTADDTGVNVTGVVTATSFVGDGSNLTGISAGSTVADDTSTNETFYPIFTQTTSGTILASKVSTTKLSFNPSTGNLSATDFNSTSDTSVKENIQIIEDPLASIVRIDGVTFTWKDTGKDSAGVTAQNLEQVLPNLVSNGDLKSVNYNGLIGYLIEAVKSQQAQIDELKSRLDSLDS